jgi:hypothetical protein
MNKWRQIEPVALDQQPIDSLVGLHQPLAARHDEQRTSVRKSNRCSAIGKVSCDQVVRT